MSMKTMFCLIAALCTLTGLIVPSTTAQVYKIIELPMQSAVGINDSAAVIGVSGGFGVLWGDDFSYNLGTLAPEGINNARQVAGAYPISPDTSHATLWEEGLRTDLGSLGGPRSVATAVNDLSEVAGYSMTGNPDEGYRAFYWKNGIMTRIETLGGNGSIAEGINDSGWVVGTSHLNDTTAHPFIWNNGTMSDLGTLGGNIAVGNAINNRGEVVGSSNLEGPAGNAAFLWSGGSMTHLGFLSPAESSWSASFANDINDSGVVVGFSTNDPGTGINSSDAAFLWHDGVMLDLNELADTGGGWYLSHAVGINNRGSIICLGTKNGDPRSALLTPASVYLTRPKGPEFWISARRDTIRWLSALQPGTDIRLEYSLDGGSTWHTIVDGYPAATQHYVWMIPDTSSYKARIRISAVGDSTQADTSSIFKLRGYVLLEPYGEDDILLYDPHNDAWGFGNNRAETWPESWWSRFDYTGTDPYTGRSYMLGGLYSTAAFLLAHSSVHPDWPAFVGAFGPDACYLNTSLSIYSPSAIAFWTSVRGPWNGSCFGFAISNAWAFRYTSLLDSRFPNLNDFVFPADLGSGPTSIPMMVTLFTHQFGRQHMDYRNQVGLLKTPTETLRDLREMLIDEARPLRTLSFLSNGPRVGGHAILAWKVLQDTALPNLWYVRVYDNSHPRNDDARIVIDTTANGGNGVWTYDLWPGWGGNRWLYLRDPASSYGDPPVLLKNDPSGRRSPFILEPGHVSIHLGGEADVTIRDSEGNVTGYSDSLLVTGIPDAIPLIVDNGSITPPYGYQVDSGSYSIEQWNYRSTESAVYFFWVNRSLIVERSDAAAGQQGLFRFDGGLTVVNPDTSEKTFNITSILNETVDEKVIGIRGLVLPGGDSVRIMQEGADGLKIISFGGAPKSYLLELESDSLDHIDRFSGAGIGLAPGDAHIIQPDLHGLGDGALKIPIDAGNDGTIDDSIFIDNSLTAIRESTPDGRPASFALYQNYPNPFNPRTVIPYDLARPARVRIQIVDVLGTVVETLVDAEETAGSKWVDWDATGYPGGVYFCRITAGPFTAVRKLILLR